MKSLVERKCIPCKSGGSPLSPEEIRKLLPQLPGWSIHKENGMTVLKKIFKFKNFKQALSFTNKVGAAAEAEDHHPAILTQWGGVTVTWVTHTIKGLHINDFKMAAETDQLL